MNVTGSTTRPVGIKDIARALGVSIGTVDRALHGRTGISPVTRKKIINMARSLGYKPNLAARMLSSRQERSISVCLPRDIQSFFTPLREGIAEAARAAEASGFRAVYRTYPRLGEGEIEAVEAALENNVHGIIIVPGDPDRLKPLIRKASSRNIPVVCVATDAPGTERLGAVCVDPLVSGAMAAELMARFLSSQGGVAVVTGSRAITDHQQKLEGFLHTLNRFAPAMRLVAVLETHDDEAEAYRQSAHAFAAAPGIRGVYVATANSMPVLRALRESGRAGSVTVIATDLFPELVPFIESGAVAATIHQRPFNQGRMAFETLQKFLVEGLTPSPVIKLAPHVVMRSNLSLFLPRARFEPENVEI